MLVSKVNVAIIDYAYRCIETSGPCRPLLARVSERKALPARNLFSVLYKSRWGFATWGDGWLNYFLRALQVYRIDR